MSSSTSSSASLWELLFKTVFRESLYDGGERGKSGRQDDGGRGVFDCSFTSTELDVVDDVTDFPVDDAAS